MTHLPDVERVHHKSVNSCLGESLRRLKNNLQQIRSSQEQDSGEFDAWLKQWSRRSDQIAKRLELIDSQLDDILEVTPPPPHFKIVEPDDH